MSAEPEPLAAILAEMHNPPHKWEAFSRADLFDLADRIEAAAERERRKYQRLHKCFWSHGAVQSVVRQMLDAASDLQGAEPKEAEDLKHYASELIDCGQTATGDAAAMRAALNSIADIAKDAFGGPEREREASQGRALSLIIDAARGALAAPARNCDRFATAEGGAE